MFPGEVANAYRPNMTPETLSGLNLVTEVLRAGRRQVKEILVSREREDSRVRRVLELAAAAGVPVRKISRSQLDREIPDGSHQGVVARVDRLRFLSEGDLLSGCGSRPFLVVLDGIEDPRNLGALLRSAVAAGVDGVLMADRRNAPLSPVAARASAGASEWARIANCGNVSAFLRRLRDRGTWTVGLDPEGERMWTDFDYRLGVAVVLGGEGRGLRPLVRRNCDATVRIPMGEGTESLNVAAAAAVVLFEAVRQRRDTKEN